MRRPHRVAPLVESIAEATPQPFRVLFLCDAGDYEEIAAIEAREEPWVEIEIIESPEPRVHVDGLRPAGANYARKINIGVSLTDEPLLLFAADDLKFHEGWFEAAKAKMADRVGVVATEDLCNAMVAAGQLATHPLVSREYCKRGTVDDPSRVLHEGYLHEYVDREFSETARFREAFAYAPDSIVEHLHPQVGKAPMDPLYRDQLRRMRVGRRIYARRRYRWMPIPE